MPDKVNYQKGEYKNRKIIVHHQNHPSSFQTKPKILTSMTLYGSRSSIQHYCTPRPTVRIPLPRL